MRADITEYEKVEQVARKFIEVVKTGKNFLAVLREM